MAAAAEPRGEATSGLAARGLADYQWDRVVGYESPYRFDLPPAPQTPRLADRGGGSESPPRAGTPRRSHDGRPSHGRCV